MRGSRTYIPGLQTLSHPLLALSDLSDILGSVGIEGKHLLISVGIKKNVVISLWTFSIFGTFIYIS